MVHISLLVHLVQLVFVGYSYGHVKTGARAKGQTFAFLTLSSSGGKNKMPAMGLVIKKTCFFMILALTLISA